MRVLISAGYDAAVNAIAVAELSRRQGVQVGGVLVVNPLNVKRARQLLKQRGWSGLMKLAKRYLGKAPASGPSETDFVRQNLAKHEIKWKSLKKWCAEFSVVYHVVPDLNGEPTLDLVRQADPDGLLYCGGGILRGPLIQAANQRVLNVHAGPLPEIRGMNACEWSVLLGLKPAVTIHYIDEGIDTGAPLEIIPVPIKPGDTLEQLRARGTALGIEGMCRNLPALAAPLPAKLPNAAAHRQCFIMAPALRELTQIRLQHAA